MNAKEKYQAAWRNVRIVKTSKHGVGFSDYQNARQMVANCYFGEYSHNEPEYKAYASFMARKAENSMMHFSQFVDCLEAAAQGLAWADRNHWYFMLGENEECCFINAEMEPFARYFNEGLFMSEYQFSRLIEYGADSISRIAFDACEVYPLNPKHIAYGRFVTGSFVSCDPAKWVTAHVVAEVFAKARDIHNDKIIEQYGANNRRVGRELRNGEVWLVEPKDNPLYKEFGK